MDPTGKKHPEPKPSTKKSLTPPQDPIPSSTLNKTTAHYSKWNANHKARAALKAAADPPPRVDTHLQAKAMTLSTNADSSNWSLLKMNPHHLRHHHHRQQQQQQTHQVEMEKRQSKTAKEKEDKVIPKERDEPKRPSVSLVSGRRRSCDPRVELGEFFSSVGVRVVAVDMPPFMQAHAASSARKAYDSIHKCTCKTLALTLKKEFDRVYGPAWHCIVGTSFGSFVTHSVGGFLYFSMDHKLYILLFKTTVQRAE